ncbi:hypothetical protein [Acidisphaera sp. S103]|uniref:hypothetical protein n=1 Tax=Acidisphaera sp. S103 TaxID=1747223 RepID=UPI00131BBC11|nr:hypothetical protein [Acidisphaera sp. S103]
MKQLAVGAAYETDAGAFISLSQQFDKVFGRDFPSREHARRCLWLERQYRSQALVHFSLIPLNTPIFRGVDALMQERQTKTALSID